MKRIQTLGLTLLAVFACGAVAASAASAHDFIVSADPAQLVGTSFSSQVWTVPAGTVTCKEDKLSGLLSEELPIRWLVLKGEYKTCSFEGFGGIKSEVTVPSVEYRFFAEPGSPGAEVKILKEFKISTTGIAPCVVTFPAQALKGVEYVNVNKETEVDFNAKLTKLTSSATGSGCKKTYTTDTTGEFKGNNLVKLVGGTMAYS